MSVRLSPRARTCTYHELRQILLLGRWTNRAGLNTYKPEARRQNSNRYRNYKTCIETPTIPNDRSTHHISFSEALLAHASISCIFKSTPQPHYPINHLLSPSFTRET